MVVFPAKVSTVVSARAALSIPEVVDWGDEVVGEAVCRALLVESADLESIIPSVLAETDF